MKPIRKRLEEARRDAGLSWEIIEKDYILSWVLAGVAANAKLQGGLFNKKIEQVSDGEVFVV